MSLRGHHQVSGGSIQTATFLVVRIGKNICALPSKEVRGVLTKEEAGRSNSVNAVGVTYHDVGLASRLTQTIDQDNSEARTVLYSNGQTHGAVRVDEVIDMIEMNIDDCRPLPPQFHGEERSWITGTTVFRNQVVLLLSPEWVLGELGEAASVRSGEGGQLPIEHRAVPGVAC